MQDTTGIERIEKMPLAFSHAFFSSNSSGSDIIDIIAKNSPLLVRNRRLPSSSPPFPFNSRIFYANKREISAVIQRRALQKKRYEQWNFIIIFEERKK